jgi:hypothetical protein
VGCIRYPSSLKDHRRKSKLKRSLRTPHTLHPTHQAPSSS